MTKSSTQLFSGGSLGLMLGLLLGLSSAPVVAVVVGALAALLGSLVLPNLPSKAGEGGASQHRASPDLAAGALGLACVAGVLLGIWLRTHDALSPKPPTLVEKHELWKFIGFSDEEARSLVVRQEGLDRPGTAAAAPTTSTAKSSILFGDRTTRCAQLAPERYADIGAAARAYEALNEISLARIAAGLAQLPDAQARMKALAVVVEVACTGG